MLRQLFIPLITVALLSGPVWAAKVLSDPELATISGAGVEFSLDGQGLPQEPQEPNQQGLFPPAANPRNSAGMELFPATLVMLQSSGTLDHRRTLLLDDDAQQGVSALSLENGYASDAVNTSNVFGGQLDIPLGEVPRLKIIQGSEVYQLYRQQGRIYSSAAGFRYEKTRQQRHTLEQRNTSIASRVGQADRVVTYQQTQSSWDVQVAKIQRPGVELSRVDTVKVPWAHRLINRFEIDASADTWLGSYGGIATYSGLTLHGPYAYYHGPYDRSEDLLIGAAIGLPTIDFGDVVIEKCVGDCDEVKRIDLGRIGGTNLLTVLETIDKEVAPDDFISFSDQGIVLHGLGELLADELNLNTGFVFVGSGHIKTKEAARVTIGAEANFGLDTQLTFRIDMRDIDALGLIADFFDKDSARWDYSREDQLLDVTIPITFVDLETPPFELEFDGLVIAQLGSGKVSADGLESAAVSHNFQDNRRVEESLSQTTGTSSFDETFIHSAFVGGQMTEAQAELLALSEGHLQVQRGGRIMLTAQAQRDIRVLHAVNAVTSIAANSLNVGTMPVPGREIVRLSLQQQNSFVQQR